MKRSVLALVLLISTTSTLYAQQATSSNEEKTFELPKNSTNRRFYIALDKGNSIRIDISNLDDLDQFKNMDSVIYGLIQDLKLLKDSLGDETTTKKIDYVMDDPENRKIRFIQFHPKASSFVVKEGEISGLKMEQDTINFIGKKVYQAKYTLRRAFTDTRYYKVSFFVNNLSDIGAYMNGTISKKIATLQQKINTGWDSKGNSSVYFLKADTSIHANANKGYIAGGDFLELQVGVDMQNYKNYFVPSITYGVNFVLGNKNFKRQIGLHMENHFSFSRNSDGKLQTVRDAFLTLSLAHGPIKDNDVRKDGYQLASLSFAYLIRNKGNIYDDRTMRLGAGTLSVFEGKLKLMPMIYFTDFFKKVTPGMRLSLSF